MVRNNYIIVCKIEIRIALPTARPGPVDPERTADACAARQREGIPVGDLVSGRGECAVSARIVVVERAGPVADEEEGIAAFLAHAAPLEGKRGAQRKGTETS